VFGAGAAWQCGTCSCSSLAPVEQGDRAVKVWKPLLSGSLSREAQLMRAPFGTIFRVAGAYEASNSSGYERNRGNDHLRCHRVRLAPRVMGTARAACSPDRCLSLQER